MKKKFYISHPYPKDEENQIKKWIGLKFLHND